MLLKNTRIEKPLIKNLLPKVSVFKDHKLKIEFESESGAILRKELFKHNLNPHSTVGSKLNCGGNGICATCGVLVHDEVPANHWHDKAAKYFGYLRLSCQITIEENDLSISLIDKAIWGKRAKKYL